MQTALAQSISSTAAVNATRVIASTLGVFAGISGLDHGFFEALQGNVGTPGLFVQAIGPNQRMWVRGTEDALTIVPNFLVTGILAMAVGLAIIVWSIRYIDSSRGSAVFLGLGAVLFLVGGGVALLGFLAMCFLVSRRIARPLKWPGRIVPSGVSGALAAGWPKLMIVAAALGLVALEIAIFGVVPGVSNPDHLLAVTWSSLGAMVALVILALMGASVADGRRSVSQPSDR